MPELIPTRSVATSAGALRVMGVWVRRADAILANQAIANAAGAVNDQARHLHLMQREADAVDLRRPAPAVAG